MTRIATYMDALFGQTRLGLGCMGLSGLFGPVERGHAIATVHHAIELGIRHFDTAELYGPFVNETILAEALHRRQDNVTVATKVGYRFEEGKRVGLDGRPENLRGAVEGCLRRLKRETIDLLYLHRQDPGVPIEESIGALSKLVSEGKAISLGLSAVDERSVARASRISPIAAVQNEYSLLSRDIETHLLPALNKEGVVCIAYSPLARGLISDGARDTTKLVKGDYRQFDMRFEPDRFDTFQRSLSGMQQIANSRQMPLEAVAIAWLLQQGVAVLPGCRTPVQLDSVLCALQIQLCPGEMQILEHLSKL